MDLSSLPPEMVLQIVDCLDQNGLCSFLRAAKFLHTLAWDILYKRDVAENKSRGAVHCIRSGAIDSLARFIAAGLDVNAPIDIFPDIQDYSGKTSLLTTAVVRNQIEIVRLLLSHGANICAINEGTLCYSVLSYDWDHTWPSTPLSMAITDGRTDIAITLIDHMANPDVIVATTRDVEYTALEQAALCLRSEIACRLLERGADPNRRSRKGATILYRIMANFDVRQWASQLPNGDEAITRTIITLLRYGADPALRPRCPVHQRGGPRHWGHECSHREECKVGLSLFNLGIKSPYKGVRQHFAELVHRQLCDKPSCKEQMYTYGMTGESIPGHCEVSPDELTVEELRLAENLW
jgi:ankyrin repeat protein